MRRLQDCNKMKFLVLNVLATAERMEAVRLGVTHLRNYADPSSSRVQRSTNYSPCLFPTKVLLPPPRLPPPSAPNPKPPEAATRGVLNLQQGWRNRSPRGDASRRVNPSPAVPAAPQRGRRRVLPAERRGACCFLRGIAAAAAAAASPPAAAEFPRRTPLPIPLFSCRNKHTPAHAHTQIKKK